jgi:hypothetical protein
MGREKHRDNVEGQGRGLEGQKEKRQTAPDLEYFFLHASKVLRSSNS